MLLASKIVLMLQQLVELPRTPNNLHISIYFRAATEHQVDSLHSHLEIAIVCFVVTKTDFSTATIFKFCSRGLNAEEYENYTNHCCWSSEHF